LFLKTNNTYLKIKFPKLIQD